MSGYRHTRGLYKDSENGVIMGVCAGFADYFDLNRTGVRIVMVVLLLFMFWPVVIGYFAVGCLLRDKPLSYRGRDERDFWSHRSHGS